jgi:hypothetical protein
MKRIIPIVFLSLIFVSGLRSQNNNVGIGTTTPDASAVLDVYSTNKGLLIPRVTLNDHTTPDPITNPATGLLIYNANGTEPHGFWYWDGTEWVQVGSSSNSGGGTLDDSYDFGGPGAGRVITADNGAVEIDMPNSASNMEAMLVTAVNGTTSNPSTGIHVVNSGIGGSIYAENTNSSNPYNTIEASTNSSNSYTSALAGYYDGSDQGVGVYGSVYDQNSSGPAGVFGINNRTNGGAGVWGQGLNGVIGETNFSDGGGVWGVNYHSQGSGDGCGVVGDGSIGVWGQTSDGPAGVKGVNARTDGGHGVWGVGVNGVVGESSYTDGYGVWGSNSASSDPGIGVAGIGVTGIAGQSTNLNLSYGVYSFDDAGIYNTLDVGGNLYVNGTKSFRIDNPNDPDNKFLVHFSIESNEILNVYRGTVELDQNGEAVVILPDYFMKVNKNFSYNLTPVGAAAPNLYIKQKITNGKFIIAGGNPGQEIDWVVYAERNDRYLQQHPELRETQPEKTGRYKGKYVHPEVWGQPKEKAILYKKPLKVLNSKQTMKKSPEFIDGKKFYKKNK